MAKNKGNDKKVEQITDMEVDFAQWFTDVCKKAQLIDYSSIKNSSIWAANHGPLRAILFVTKLLRDTNCPKSGKHVCTSQKELACQLLPGTMAGFLGLIFNLGHVGLCQISQNTRVGSEITPGLRV